MAKVSLRASPAGICHEQSHIQAGCGVNVGGLSLVRDELVEEGGSLRAPTTASAEPAIFLSSHDTKPPRNPCVSGGMFTHRGLENRANSSHGSGHPRSPGRMAISGRLTKHANGSHIRFVDMDSAGPVLCCPSLGIGVSRLCSAAAAL